MMTFLIVIHIFVFENYYFFGINTILKLKYSLSKYNPFEVTFFASSIFLSIVVLFDFMYIEYTLKLFCMFSLAFLYNSKTEQKNKWYFIALFFATISNLFFIFQEISYLTIGLVSFIIYRVIILTIVIHATQKFYFLAVLIGTILFLIPLIYFVLLSYDSFQDSLIPAIVNVILIAVLGGMSVSNYLMEPAEKNTWLLISTLLFAFLTVIFVIQKYYIFIPILDSIRIIVLMGAHYIFYRYMLLTSN